MLSLKSTLLAAAALVVRVQADYVIDPTSVPLATRKSWCTAEISICPAICLDSAPGSGKPITNTCDPATLTYGCVCGNGIQPNVSEYTLTLPYYICQRYQENCVAACGIGNNQCANNCRTDNPCGALSPKTANVTSTTTDTTASATSTGIELATGYPGSSGSSSSTSGSHATHSTSIQASFTLATVITSLLVGPFLLL